MLYFGLVKVNKFDKLEIYNFYISFVLKDHEKSTKWGLFGNLKTFNCSWINESIFLCVIILIWLWRGFLITYKIWVLIISNNLSLSWSCWYKRIESPSIC